VKGREGKRREEKGNKKLGEMQPQDFEVVWSKEDSVLW
jgi:hypothetical protein